MDSFQAIAVKASVKSLTILTGIVLGEICHRFLNFSNDENSHRNANAEGHKRTSRRRKRRSTVNGGWLSRFEKQLWKKFEAKIFCSALVLSLAYLVIVGYQKVSF
jgi:hypothetical protein